MSTSSLSLTIRACAEATGVTPDTLRYYEKIGLLPRVPRERNGHRRFGDDEVRWITFLRRLHTTGMPIRHMQQYARLVRRGDGTMAERRALLERHRREVRQRMEALEENLRMIEKKIAHYDSACAGGPLAGPAPRVATTGSRRPPTLARALDP